MEIAQQPQSTAARGGPPVGVQPFGLTRRMRSIPVDEWPQLLPVVITLARELLADSANVCFL
jgi:hypothetical protein